MEDYDIADGEQYFQLEDMMRVETFYNLARPPYPSFNEVQRHFEGTEFDLNRRLEIGSRGWVEPHRDVRYP